MDILRLFSCFWILSNAAKALVSKLYKNYEFTLLTSEQNFDDSQQMCVEMGAHLAVITDDKEQNFITNLIRSLADPKDTWIGLYKPTRHVADTRWIDNTPFVFNDINYYQPWFPGDPNERNAACVRIEAASARWRDKPCGRNFWAVCERELPVLLEERYTTYTGTGSSFSLLKTGSETSDEECLVMCMVNRYCVGVKSVYNTGSDVTCKLYKEPEASSVVTVTNLTLKVT